MGRAEGLIRAAELLRGRAGLKGSPWSLKLAFFPLMPSGLPPSFLGLEGHFWDISCCVHGCQWYGQKTIGEMIHLDSSLLESTPRSRAFQWCNKSVHIWTGRGAPWQAQSLLRAAVHTPAGLRSFVIHAAPHREETGSPCLFLELQGHYDTTYLAGHL